MKLLFISHTTPCILGAYENPSLSVWPSPNVNSGVSIAFTCSSYMGYGRFILIQEGKHHLSWTLDSQHQNNQPFLTTFVLHAVTPNHNGTFRCYGSFKNESQVWSKSSDPLDLRISGKYPTHHCLVYLVTLVTFLRRFIRASWWGHTI